MIDVDVLIDIDPDFRCMVCNRQQFDYLELVDLIECTFCMECYSPAQARTIPYDKMRELCGLPDVKLQVALDWARRTQILPYVQWGESFIDKWELTIGRTSTPVPWPGGKVPDWVPVASEKQIVESATRAAAETGKTVEEYLEMITNLVESAPLPKPERRPLPKPSHTPPMWAQNPARTKRTRNRSTDIRTPGK